MKQSHSDFLGISTLMAGAALACSSPQQLGEKLDEPSSSVNSTTPSTATPGTGSTSSGGSTNTTSSTKPGEKPATGGNSTTSAVPPNAGGTAARTYDPMPIMGGFGGNALAGAGGTAMGLAGAAGTPSFDEVCTLPSVKFEFTVDDPTAYCWDDSEPLAGVTRNDGDGTDYRAFEIYTEQGEYVSYVGRGPATSRKHRPACPACGSWSEWVLGPTFGPMPLTPITGTWSGDSEEVHYCGTAKGSCGILRCAPAGRYKAKFCVAPKGAETSCADLPRTRCIEVPFDFPTSTLVTGRITSNSECPLTQPAVGDPCVGTQSCLYDITTQTLYQGQFNCEQREFVCTEEKYQSTGLHCDPM